MNSDGIPSKHDAPLKPLRVDQDHDEAFEHLYRTHFRRIVGALIVAGSPPDRATDLTQEAFARTLARWARVRRGSNPAGYVYTTAFRLARRRSWLRTLDIRPGRDDEGSDDPTTVVTTTMLLRHELESMPQRRRECAGLCLFSDHTYAEAAQILSIQPGTVRSHVHHARRQLREALTNSSRA